MFGARGYLRYYHANNINFRSSFNTNEVRVSCTEKVESYRQHYHNFVNKQSSIMNNTPGGGRHPHRGDVRGEDRHLGGRRALYIAHRGHRSGGGGLHHGAGTLHQRGDQARRGDRGAADKEHLGVQASCRQGHSAGLQSVAPEEREEPAGCDVL